jgi:tetratricopeptide (TPR) repeat protein
MSDPAPKAIFLSYARDDAAAARRIAEALRSIGLEVWFDENELRGGDTWDAKIRKQINDCTLFVPIISQHTEERAKGYFRLEWKLAVDQTHLLAEGVPFIAPVVIDDTRENGATVPAEFLRVQWMRLPGALPTPQFVEQVKRLLDAPQKSVAASSRAAGGREVKPREVDRALRARFGWLVGGAVAIALVGAVGWMWLHQNSNAVQPSEPAARRSAPPTPEKPAPVSEERQLVAKARALYEPWDFASREDFNLAEQLLKKATELDPTDGDAWAAYALLSCGFIVVHGDTDERMLAARKQAERAIALAPDSNAARFVRAFSLRFDPQTRDECIRLLREEVARQPTNRLLVRTLGNTLRVVGQFEQALVYYDKALAISGADPITHYVRAAVLRNLGRFAEAEASIDEALALAPTYVRAHGFKISLLLEYHGNLALARAQLGKVPSTYLTSDEGALTAGLVWLYSRDSARCLAALRNASDYLQVTTLFRGPKAFLTGMAQKIAGNADAARADWRAALQLIEQRLAVQPNAIALLGWKAALLAELGERAEVEPLLREIRQRKSTGDGGVSDSDLARILVLLEKPDEAIAFLESAKQSFFSSNVVRINLLYDSAWDPLRGNPRFEALLKAPEQKR